MSFPLIHGCEVIIGFETHAQLLETRLLNVAHRLQQATDFHLRVPKDS